jgi:50S ribosomal subunit-associated GTPase HflX
MPANLPPQYFEAEKRLRMAKTPEEKIEALETMLAIMPKHKGTDKLHAELRRKIAKITEEAERTYATSRTSFHIRKEGAGQVALVGLPNTGKSQLLASLTEATPEAYSGHDEIPKHPGPDGGHASSHRQRIARLD